MALLTCCLSNKNQNKGASSMLNNKPSVFLAVENHLLREVLASFLMVGENLMCVVFPQASTILPPPLPYQGPTL